MSMTALTIVDSVDAANMFANSLPTVPMEGSAPMAAIHGGNAIMFTITEREAAARIFVRMVFSLLSFVIAEDFDPV